MALEHTAQNRRGGIISTANESIYKDELPRFQCNGIWTNGGDSTDCTSTYHKRSGERVLAFARVDLVGVVQDVRAENLYDGAAGCGLWCWEDFDLYLLSALNSLRVSCGRSIPEVLLR